MTEQEHIIELYGCIEALAMRITVLEQTRWRRFKNWITTLLLDYDTPLFP